MTLNRLFTLRRCAFTLLTLALLTGAVWAGDPESIRLTAVPATILADGTTTTNITAEVRDRDGRLVDDNTVVGFSTTLGSIENTAQTRGGQATVRLTSASLPGTATVTATAGHATAQITVAFTAEPVTGAQQSVRSVIVRADYLLYNDYERIIDAVGGVDIRIGDVTITADRAQVNFARNAIVAQGEPGASELKITGGKTTLAGDKLHYNWDSRIGFISGLQDPVRGAYSFHSATMVAQKMTTPPPADTFTLQDLIPSPLAVKASRIILLPGEELQFTDAQIMLNGKKRITLPYHVIPLGPSRAGQAQWVGMGPRGPLVDIPYYLAAGEKGTSQLRLKYNAPEGLYGATIAGWALDLVSKYNIDGNADGNLALTRLTSPDWGLTWTHNQTLGPSTHANFSADTRAYSSSQRYTIGNANVFHQGTGYSLNLTGNLNKFLTSNGYVALAAQTTPKLLPGGFAWSLGSRMARNWTHATYQDPNTSEIYTEREVTNAEGLSARIIAPTTTLLGAHVTAAIGSGLSFSRGRTGRSILGTVGVSRALGRNGTLNLAYNYNDFGQTSNDLYGIIGLDRQTVTATLTYGKYPKWTTSAFATFGLEQHSQNINVNAIYNIAANWRFQANASLFRHTLNVQDTLTPDEFRRVDFQATNVEVRLTRLLGERALSLVYESYRNRVYLDYQPGTWW